MIFVPLVQALLQFVDMQWPRPGQAYICCIAHLRSDGSQALSCFSILPSLFLFQECKKFGQSLICSPLVRGF